MDLKLNMIQDYYISKIKYKYIILESVQVFLKNSDNMPTVNEECRDHTIEYTDTNVMFYFFCHALFQEIPWKQTMQMIANSHLKKRQQNSNSSDNNFSLFWYFCICVCARVHACVFAWKSW